MFWHKTANGGHQTLLFPSYWSKLTFTTLLEKSHFSTTQRFWLFPNLIKVKFNLCKGVACQLLYCYSDCTLKILYLYRNFLDFSMSEEFKAHIVKKVYCITIVTYLHDFSPNFHETCACTKLKLRLRIFRNFGHAVTQ